MSPSALVAGGAGLAVWLAVAPAAASSDPSATLTPADGLTNGQVVTVEGSGFPPSDQIIIIECGGTVANPPADATSCDGTTTDSNTSVDIRGHFTDAPSAASGTTGYTVKTIGKGAANAAPCDAANPCVLFVGVDLNDFGRPHTFVPLNFAATASASPAASTPAAAVTTADPAVQPAATPTRPTVAATPAAAGAGASTPASGAALAAQSVRPASSALPSGLPATGPPRDALWLLAASMLTIGAGTLARRRALRIADGG